MTQSSRLRSATPNTDAARPRRGDVEPVEAVEKLHIGSLAPGPDGEAA